MNRIKESFDRAFFHLFAFKKFLTLFLALLTSSLFFVAFQQIAYGQPFWIQQILFFIPLFLGVVVLFGSQIVLTHAYLKQCEGTEDICLKKSAWQLLPAMVKLSYFIIPLIFFYLILLLLSGTFLLFTQLPFIGVVFKTVLAFIPFLLNLSLLLIFMALLFFSFYVVPLIAIDAKQIRKRLYKRMTVSPFVQFVYLALPLTVVIVVWKVLMLAVEMSANTYLFQESSMEVLLQSFSIMIPFTALFTFPILFLWHFATESTKLIESNTIRSK